MEQLFSSAIIELLAIQDKYTVAHSVRVTKYSFVFAECIKLTPKETKTLCRSAYLHDIGKTAINDELLFKKNITPEEKHLLTEHVIESYNIVKCLPNMEEEAKIIYAHHERWDGKGYPLGLSGTQIPLLARMLTITDCYDALLSKRPYKKAMKNEEALTIMLNSAGQFDPVLLDRFITFSDTILERSKKVNLYTIIVD